MFHSIVVERTIVIMPNGEISMITQMKHVPKLCEMTLDDSIRTISLESGGDGMGVWNENDVNIGAVWEDLISYFFDVFAGDLFEREV